MSHQAIELAEANAFVAKHHRHHKPVQGHRFSIGAYVRGTLCGVVIVGRPVARMVNQRTCVEVTRLCTDGTKNACSFLYSAAARAAKEIGYKRIQTYILDNETGTSLKASGWVLEATTSGGLWARESRPDRRSDQPNENKQRWGRTLNATPNKEPAHARE